MNIFLHEIKMNFRSLLIWIGIMAVWNFAAFAEFSGYYGNPEMVDVINTMPPAFLEAFSMQAFNITTTTGFLGVLFTFLALMLSIAAALWGSDVISKEERDKTVEFSLTLPVTRIKIVAAKSLAVLVNCILLLLVTWGTLAFSASQYEMEPGFLSFMNLCFAALFIIMLIFLAAGIFLACVLKRSRASGTAAVGIILGTYFVSIISGLHEKLDFLKFISPFKYFDPLQLLHEGVLETNFLLLSAVLVLVSISVGFMVYSKRDLNI